MIKPSTQRMPRPAQPALLRAKGTDRSPTPVTILMTLSTAWLKVAFPTACMEEASLSLQVTGQRGFNVVQLQLRYQSEAHAVIFL